jgi:hypothetical protein
MKEKAGLPMHLDLEEGGSPAPSRRWKSPADLMVLGLVACGLLVSPSPKTAQSTQRMHSDESNVCDALVFGGD